MNCPVTCGYDPRILTLFLAVVTTFLLNFINSFTTATLPFEAAMWAQVIPFCKHEPSAISLGYMIV